MSKGTRRGVRHCSSPLEVRHHWRSAHDWELSRHPSLFACFVGHPPRDFVEGMTVSAGWSPTGSWWPGGDESMEVAACGGDSVPHLLREWKQQPGVSVLEPTGSHWHVHATMFGWGRWNVGESHCTHQTMKTLLVVPLQVVEEEELPVAEMCSDQQQQFHLQCGVAVVESRSRIGKDREAESGWESPPCSGETHLRENRRVLGSWRSQPRRGRILALPLVVDSAAHLLFVGGAGC